MVFRDRWKIMSKKEKLNLANSLEVTYVFLSRVANGTAGTVASKTIKIAISSVLKEDINELFPDS